MLGAAPSVAVLPALEMEPGLVEVAACVNRRTLPLNSLAPGAAAAGGEPPAVVEAICLEDVDTAETLLCSKLPAAS